MTSRLKIALSIARGSVFTTCSCITPTALLSQYNHTVFLTVSDFVVNRLLLNTVRTNLSRGRVSPYSESVPQVGHVHCFKVTGWRGINKALFGTVLCFLKWDIFFYNNRGRCKICCDTKHLKLWRMLTVWMELWEMTWRKFCLKKILSVDCIDVCVVTVIYRTSIGLRHECLLGERLKNR